MALYTTNMQDTWDDSRKEIFGIYSMSSVISPLLG